MGIGLQGNIRKLGVNGEDLPFVQYQLDDPDEYSGETIVVVGAGDAAIENAIALSKQNQVIIVNRRDEFARAKQGNLDGILKAIDDGSIECYYNAGPEKVEALTVGRKPGPTDPVHAQRQGPDPRRPHHCAPRRHRAARLRRSLRRGVPEQGPGCGAGDQRAVRIQRQGPVHRRCARRLSADQAGDEPGL
ncbi:MAG: NAD(P)-binding domain-containing protein [Chiayiivirga sp.]|jgi:hypothetical protein|nr:NAD(P)-binding domain-containing protein [Chiayiivirga sp.]